MKRLLSCLFALFVLASGIYAQVRPDVVVTGADGEEVFRFQVDTVDPAMRRLPAEVLSERQKNTDEFLRLLAEYISGLTDNDFDRVKKAHDWVALNIRYDTVSYFSGRYRSQDYDTVVKRGLAVCAGYAEIFSALCAKLGIECEIVAGFARGIGRNLFRNEDISDTNHDWNIVTIDGKKYLIDSTWDAGYLNGRNFRAQYSTTYLFADPLAFLCLHFPNNPASQLLDPPLEPEAFSKLPFVDPGFTGALEEFPVLEKVTEIPAGEEFTLEFVAKPEYELIYGWYRSGGARLSRGDIFPGRLDIYSITSPKLRAGNYELRVWARPVGSRVNSGYAAFGFTAK